MTSTKNATNRWRKFIRITLYTLSSLLLLIIAVLFALTLPPVQRRITAEAQSFLQKKLGTRVEVGALGLRFPYHVSLERLLIEDQQQDTLLRVGSLVLTIDMWKLLDQTIELQQISLKDAAVYLHRKDSVYNFDFVARAFSNPDKPASTDTLGSPWKLQVDLTKIRLGQVKFLLKDEDAASTTSAHVGSMNTVLVKADIDNMLFELDDLQLFDSDFRIIEQKESIPSGKPSPSFGFVLTNSEIARTHVVYSTTTLGVTATLEKSTLGNFQLQSAGNSMTINAKDVHLENSAVAYRDPESTATPGHFNAGDIGLTQLNANLPEFLFQNDTIIVQAESATGTDKSGLRIHSLSTSAHITPETIQLKDVAAHLNQTQINGDILLRKTSEATFGYMQVQLRQAKGVVSDLVVLLPPSENTALAQLGDMPYEASGELSGWLENLQTKHIQFRAGTGTRADFDGSMQNLTEPSELGMDLTISRLETNRADLVRFMSMGDAPVDSILAQPLPAYLRTSGTLNGNMARLELNMSGEVGDLQTGSVFAPVTGPALQFSLSGSLTDANDVDKLGMDLQIKRLEAPKNFFAFLEPQGIHLPDMLEASGTLKGTLSALETDLQFNALRGGANSTLAFKGLLKNVRTPDQLGFDVGFDASLARREISGYVPDSVLGPLLHLPDFVQLKGKARGTVKNAAGDVQIGLGNWGRILLDGTLRDSSYDVNIAAQNILVSQLAVDTTLRPLKTIGFTGQLHGTGFQFGETANLQFGGKVDSLIWENIILRDIVLNADVTGKQFTGALQSPDERAAITAKVSGDFSKDWPLLETDIALNCLELFPFGWAKRPTTLCMHLISRSEGISLDSIKAHLTLQDLDLQYDSVHIHPGDMTFDVQLHNRQNQLQITSDWLNGEIKGYFSLEDLPTTISNIVEQYFVVDRSTYVPRLGTDSLTVTIDLLNTDVLVSGLIPGLSKMGPVHLEGSMIAPRNYFNLIVHAPHIVYQDWDVDSLNVRAYAGDSAALFVLTTPSVKRGDQDFFENGVLNGRFVANTGTVSFKASNDEGRERFLVALEASMNNDTKETIFKFNPRQLIDFKEWTVNSDNQVRFTPTGIQVENFILEGNGQSVRVEGATSNLAGNKTGLDFAVDVERLNYSNFDLFFASLLRDLEGWGEAHLTLKGNTDDLKIRGSMQLHETAFTLLLTNVHYKLSETPLVFTETGIAVKDLTLTDPYGKNLEINGKLSTTNWTDIESNLTLHADRWQVMNSTKKQNSEYYGELFVSLDGTLRGPISQPDLKVSVRTAKESNFTYVYDVATRALEHEGVVVFLAPARQYVQAPSDEAPIQKQPYTLSASIEIDSNLVVNSVINPVTGDDFRGRASGKLQLDILSNGTMTLAGRVELVRGVYNYSYQSVVKRSFEVSNGSSITWTGDIGSPVLDLKAHYRFKASPYPLVVNQLSSASAEETARYRKPQVFILQTSVEGSVMQPNVGFQFIYPSEEKQNGLGTNFGNQQASLVENALNTVNQDKNLLSRQVFGVLMLRNFIGESAGSISSNVANPLESGLSSFLTGQLNALADQYLTWIDIDLSTGDGRPNSGASSADDGTNYQLQLQKSFFEDRLTFRISGGTTVGGSGSESAQSSLENASVEYALTPTGEWKVSVFSERGFELLNASSANLRNSGAGLIFAKEFGKK